MYVESYYFNAKLIVNMLLFNSIVLVKLAIYWMESGDLKNN